MTFADWHEKNDTVRVEFFGNSLALRIFEHDCSPEEYRKLWSLSDYKVSALVSGPAVVLSPTED